MSPAQARCCLMARGAIKMISPVPDHHAGPSPLPARKALEVLFGKGQRGGKFRLPLPEALAHVGAILPGPLGFHP